MSYQNFTLVNAYARFWRRSRGYCPPPQDELIFPTAGLVLTFALSREMYDIDSDWDPRLKDMFPKWSYVWGFEFNHPRFFTMCIPIFRVKNLSYDAYARK